jgi:hypothetical protein
MVITIFYHIRAVVRLRHCLFKCWNEKVHLLIAVPGLQGEMTFYGFQISGCMPGPIYSISPGINLITT